MNNTVVEEEVCANCENTKDLLKAIMGMVKDRHQSKEDLDYLEKLYDVQNAVENIDNYRNHIVRKKIQELEWNRLRQNVDETTCYVTGDWVMIYSGKMLL